MLDFNLSRFKCKCKQCCICKHVLHVCAYTQTYRKEWNCRHILHIETYPFSKNYLQSIQRRNYTLQKYYLSSVSVNSIWPITQWSSLVAQKVKNLPAMQETRVQSLGGEEPLEEGMATHSRALAWRIPWKEVPGRATVHGGCRESDTTEQLTHTQ